MGKEHWFFNCSSEQDIKKRFHELMLIHHPDRGGDLQTCQEIVGQYHEALKSCQYTGAEWNGTRQTYRYNETLEREFEEAMNWAMTLTFCKIELNRHLVMGYRKNAAYQRYPEGEGLPLGKPEECLVLPCGTMETEQKEV